MAALKSLVWLLVGLFLTSVHGAAGGASTDTITWGGDVSRSGYQTNHNMDPAIVGSGNFGQIFKTKLPGNFNGIGPEQIFSQPLVYTGADGVQYVYIATTQNNIYKLDAKTGNIIAQRNLWTPFLTADLDGCVDINPTVGVTATGTIDPSTGVWYLTAKTYSSQFQNGQYSANAPPGRLNGRYYFHAINTADLSDFFAPTPLEGTVFRNNPNRLFISGNQHQRPALLQVGNYIYTGYASHCVKWNFTGAIIGFNKNTGAIVEAFATEGGPEANSVPGGGVWMSGGGLAYDGKGSMFFGTGNGYASQLAANGQSVPGRNPPTALEEAAVNAKINDDGTISIIDFFMPWEKTQLDGADKDLGTSPLELLPSDTFSCPNHKRIGVITGKSGKTYWLNLDNLGGYQNGPNKLDNVIQVYQNENSVYAGAGVMPLGGGYIYINVIQYQSHVFKFSCDSQGNAQFTKVADTAEKNAYILGVGHGTTTSLNGQDGTGLYWVSDVEGLNLRIYNAIPPSIGSNLTLVNSFNIAGVTKFTRPVFGDGRAYMGTTQGYLYGFGSPVSLPLNCSSPYTFPRTPLGNSSAPVTVTCKSNIQTTVNTITLAGNPNFAISNLPSMPFQLQPGSVFNFTGVFSPKQVGPLSSDVIVNTTNGVTGYSTSTPVTLKGTANSANPLLAISPNTASFNTIAGQGTDSRSVLFVNNGDGLLTFQNVSYSTQSETGPWIQPNSTSSGNSTSTVQVGPWTFSNVPSSIPPNTANAVVISYNPTQPGNDAVFVKGFSNGGNAILDVVGVAGSQPAVVFQFQTPDGSGWVNYDPTKNFTFGNVTENTTRNLQFRIINNGSSTAAPLSLTVSKPPYGVPGILGAANNVDLAEGTSIPAGQSANATLYCSPPKQQVNSPGYTQAVQWTINTNDPNSGKQFINFTCNAVAEQLGPVYANNGTSRYQYVGCARDNNPSRQLDVQIYNDNTNNTVDKCTTACYNAGWIFAATQYQSQCWCGNAIPIKFDREIDCNYQCTGDSRQTCGGNGQYGNQTEMSLFADVSRFNGNKTSPPLGITQTYQNYNYIGCFAESGGKALSTKTTQSTGMTVESCGAFCAGYTYFGLEYSQQCACGNAINTKVATIGADNQCSMTCAGSNSEYCGAGNRMQVYGLNGTAPIPTSATTSSAPASTSSSAPAINNYLYQGCYTEVNGRALNAATKADSTVTNNVCASFCSGYKYFATEYGQECYCGNTLAAGSGPATDGRCNMQCAGDSTQTCGGPNGLSLYMLAPPNSTTSSTTSSAASTSLASTSTASIVSTSTASTSTASIVSTSITSTTPSPTPTGPVVVPFTSGYSALGCYAETPSAPRAMTNLYANDSMTIEMCAAQALKINAAYFGVEYGRECWYGPTLDTRSTPIAQSKCSFKCPGNQYEYCGAGNALQLYNFTGSATTSLTSTTVLSTSTSLTSATTTAVNSTSSVASSSTVASTTSSVFSTTSSATSTTSSATSTSSSAAPTTTSSTSSTASSTSTSTTSSSVASTTSAVSTSSTLSTSTQASTTDSGSSTSSQAPTSTSSSSASSSSSSSSSSTDPGTTTTTTSSSLASSTTTSSSSSSSSSSSTLPVSTTVTVTATTTFLTATTASGTTFSQTVTSTFTTAFPSQTPLACPGSNSTIWYAPSGAQFIIECGIDHSGGDLSSTYVNSYEQCITACDNKPGCVDVSLRSNSCYMKKSVGRAVYDSGIFGARLLPSTTSSGAAATATTKKKRWAD